MVLNERKIAKARFEPLSALKTCIALKSSSDCKGSGLPAMRRQGPSLSYGTRHQEFTRAL
jgi:hypothetical protein